MEREREGEKHQCVVAPRVPPTGDLACNPGMCPDWEVNQRLFASQSGPQFTEPHQPGCNQISYNTFSFSHSNTLKDTRHIQVCKFFDKKI